ncbi:MAG: hypothetical protein NTU80_06605 [Verrucomicrobia bacterium]|nr:hypothetical protein [Verrucomicrobiota bacterium]
MSTLTKTKKPQRSRKRDVTVPMVPLGGVFSGREHLFGSLSFAPVKGSSAKRLIHARIAADHNT